jgi:hypothetical protein
MSAVLAGDRTAVGELLAQDPDEVCRAARGHGLAGLIAEQLLDAETAGNAVAVRLRLESRAGAAADVVRERELIRLVDDFDRHGIHALLFKGAHLAYSVYDRPDLRPRLDTDLLIDPADRERAHARLLSLGYESPAQVTGAFVAHQAFYVKRQGPAEMHAVDLHWRISNPELFSRYVTLDELRSEERPLPRLSSAARGPAPVHALLIACVHRVAHHFDSERAVWLYDLHAIAGGLTDVEWKQFVALATGRQVAGICRTGLSRSIQLFGTSCPAWVLSNLESAAAAGEPTAAYLAQDRRLVENFVADLKALDGWHARVRLMREHLFPPAEYMRRVYAPSSHAPLVVLYAWRAVRGARRWFLRGAA